MSESSLLARRISDGLYGRLAFEFACNRGHAFSEAHMHVVLMEILASDVDPRTIDIQPGHPLEAIRAPGQGKRLGRRRAVDFAVLTRADPPAVPELRVCIEAKWAGSSHANKKHILRDIVRLALIKKAHPEAICLFVLAGGKSDVNRKLSLQLPSLSVRHDDPPLLRYPYDGGSNKFNLRTGPGMRLVHLNSDSVEDLRSTFSTYPDRILSFLYEPSHAETPNWSVQVWRIEGMDFKRHS